ncbi:MAG: hypothetical protein U9O55_00455 [Patescibacteria group bacterium]|nr:hypothetical protein [Patescibacteria group bacterium]
MELEKQKNQKIKFQLIFAFAILFVISLLFGFLIINKSFFLDKKEKNYADNQKTIINKNKETENPYDKNPLPPADQEKLKSEYKEKIKKIIDSYEESKTISNTGFWADFSYSTLDKLFNMIVPANKKEFHLKLVRGFNIINQSANNKISTDGIGNGFEMVDNAIKKYLEKK